MNRIKNSKKHGNQNFLKFNPTKKKINNLENNSSRKIKMNSKSRYNKNNERDKPKSEKNLKRHKEWKQICKIRINSSNLMLKSVSNSGKGMERTFIPSSSTYLKLWKIEIGKSLIEKNFKYFIISDMFLFNFFYKVIIKKWKILLLKYQTSRVLFIIKSLALIVSTTASSMAIFFLIFYDRLIRLNLNNYS